MQPGESWEWATVMSKEAMFRPPKNSKPGGITVTVLRSQLACSIKETKGRDRRSEWTSGRTDSVGFDDRLSLSSRRTVGRPRHYD